MLVDICCLYLVDDTGGDSRTTHLNKSVIYPMLPNVYQSIMCDGNNFIYTQADAVGLVTCRVHRMYTVCVADTFVVMLSTLTVPVGQGRGGSSSSSSSSDLEVARHSASSLESVGIMQEGDLDFLDSPILMSKSISMMGDTFLGHSTLAFNQSKLSLSRWSNTSNCVLDRSRHTRERNMSARNTISDTSMCSQSVLNLSPVSMSALLAGGDLVSVLLIFIQLCFCSIVIYYLKDSSRTATKLTTEVGFSLRGKLSRSETVLVFLWHHELM